MAAVASIEDAAECGERADALVRDLLGRVMRQRRSVAAAMDYVRGCRGRRGRAAGSWRRRPGMRGPHRMQALLRTCRWRWEELCGLLPGLAQEILRDDPAGPGLAFDETADLRKGGSAACVSPQHAGVTGKAENCVTRVFAALVTASGPLSPFPFPLSACCLHQRRSAAPRLTACPPSELAALAPRRPCGGGWPGRYLSRRSGAAMSG